MVRLSVLGTARFAMRFDDPAVSAAFGDCVVDGAIDPDRLAPHARAALVALREGAPGDVRLERMLAVWRGWLERRGAPLPTEAPDGEAALLVRYEHRLAVIVAGMEQARDAGDDDLVEALHARYIELGTSYARRALQR